MPSVSISSHTPGPSAKINTLTQTRKASPSRNFKKNLMRSMIAPFSKMKNKFESKAVSQPSPMLRFANVWPVHQEWHRRESILEYETLYNANELALFDTAKQLGDTVIISC
jgi:hypothetical protein